MRNFLLLILLAPVIGFAQNPAEAEIKKLYTAFHDIDIDYLSEHICSKSEGMALYGQLDNYFLNAETKFRYVMTNAKYEYAPAKTIEGVVYQPFKFRNIVRVTFFKPIDVASTQTILKEKFAAQSIVYNKDRNAFMITYQAKMVAFKTGTSNWKFAVLDNTIPAEISADCFSDAVKKELGI